MRLNQKIAAMCFFASLPMYGQTAAPATETSTTNLPPIGIASSETLQVNLVNTAPAPSAGAAGACSGSVSFYDVNGNTIGSPADFKVANGQTFSVKLPFASAEPTANARIVVRAAISVTITPGVLATDPC